MSSLPSWNRTSAKYARAFSLWRGTQLCACRPSFSYDRAQVTVWKEGFFRTGWNGTAFLVIVFQRWHVHNNLPVTQNPLHPQRHNSTQLNSTQLNSTQLNSTQLNSTQLNSTRHSTAQHSTAQHSTTQNHTAPFRQFQITAWSD